VGAVSFRKGKKETNQLSREGGTSRWKGGRNPEKKKVKIEARETQEGAMRDRKKRGIYKGGGRKNLSETEGGEKGRFV